MKDPRWPPQRDRLGVARGDSLRLGIEVGEVDIVDGLLKEINGTTRQRLLPKPRIVLSLAVKGFTGGRMRPGPLRKPGGISGRAFPARS